MKTLALDPSTTVTGFACPWEGGILITGDVTVDSGAPQEDRLSAMMRTVRCLVGALDVERLVWEIPVRGDLLRAMDGALRGYVRALKLDYARYYPSEVKKGIAGSGKAPKDAVGRAVHLRFPQLAGGASEHVCDALAVLDLDRGHLTLAEHIEDKAERAEYIRRLRRSRTRKKR